MSIIIQAGHNSSKSNLLMEKLYENGLNRPLNSYNHKLSPKEISKTVYKILSRKDVSASKNNLSDNIMVDLLLSNLDSESWGWEAEENLLALNYWHQLDTSTRFLLVFDHPNEMLSQITSESLTADELNRFINNWINYHKEMLDFLENNIDKAVLVEGAYAVNNIGSTCKKIESIFQGISFETALYKGNTSFLLNNDYTFPAGEFKKTKDYLFEEILRKFPEISKIFNVLLSKSLLNSSKPIYEKKQIGISNLISIINYTSKYNEYNKIKEEDSRNKDLTKRLEQANREKYEIESELLEMKNLMKNAKEEIESFKVKENIGEAEIDKNGKLEQENEMIIAQLHYVQEELEKLYLKKEDKGFFSDENLSNNTTIHSMYYGAAERVKGDLPYRLGATMIKEGKSAKGLAILPLSLAKEYKKFKKECSDLDALPRLEDYQDAYEGEKVKNHLSYQLGNTLVEGLGHPLRAVKIPYKSFKHILDFKKK